MRAMEALLRLAVAVLLAVSLLPLAVYHLAAVWTGHPGWPADGLGCLMGLILALLLVVWRRPNRLVHTLIHETCHAVLCLVLLVKISRFSASDGAGGEVRHRAVDPLRGTLISIAPYTLPLLLLPVLLLHPVVVARHSWWRPAWSALVVALYVHHLVGLARNLRLNFWGRESDLAKVGRPLGLVLIVGVLALVTAWTVAVLW